MVEHTVVKLMSIIPQEWKIALSRNSWVGATIHTILNRLPMNRFPVLACRGPLESYRMKIDWHVHRSYIYGTWEPDVVQTISSSVSRDMITLDIGSHIGFYTLLMAKIVGPKGTVYAFEPLPVNFRILEDNVRMNHLDNVRIFPKAVSDGSGTATLLLDDDHELPGKSSLTYRSSQGERLLEVETVTIDEFMSSEQLSVNFIKIDVEGAEELVLKGALETIQQHRPILLIELHEMSHHGKNHPVIHRLQSLNYHIQWLDENVLTAHILAHPT